MLEYIKELHADNQSLIEKLEGHLRELEKRVRAIERVIWAIGGAIVLAQVVVQLFMHYVK